MPVVWALLPAIAAIFTARKKHRKAWLWFINCWLTGFIGWIVVAISNNLDYDEDIEETTESDTLGWVMLIIGIIILALSCWYGYESAKSYHDQMFWNFHNQIMSR